MLDGSFPPLLTPTPRRRVSIATKHLRLTKREYISYKWDSFKHHAWRKFGRHLCFLNLPNIASLLFIMFMLKTTMKGHENIVSDVLLSKTAERSLSSLKEMDFRMNMITEQQERIRQFANDEILGLRKQLERSVETLKKDFLKDIERIKDLADTSDAEKQAQFSKLVQSLESNFTTKFEMIHTELSNISRVFNRTRKVIFRGLVNQTESLSRLEQNFSRIEQNFSRIEEILNKTSSSSKTPPEYHGVNLANRKLGAKNVAILSSGTYSFDSYLNRLSAYFYSQDLLDWPLMDRVTVNPGEAFCFDGNTGDYTVELASKRNLKSVMYEHDYWPDLVPVSAPKDYQIWTCSKGCNSIHSFNLAATCLYSSRGNPAQTCELTNNTEDVHSIRMRILSNYGQRYTCMYVLRVYAA